MSAWWPLVAFVAGWAACWYLSRFLLKNVLRRGDSLTAEVLSGLPQEKLLRVYATVEKELAKRRAPAQPSQQRGETHDGGSSSAS